MELLDTHQMFSDPGKDAVVMSAWERFLNGEGAPSDTLRCLIDVSWQRCQQAQVDPARSSAPPPPSGDLLYTLHQSHSELLAAGAPVMAHARKLLSESGTMMALADPAGTILTVEGDAATVGSAENIQLLPGTSWNEQVCGTNAIGTALEVGQPVQIHSAEHYCAGIKRWTCSATVIRHPHDGEIIGVIDVSGLSESYHRQSLALAVTTASRIENRLAALEMERRYRLLEHFMRRAPGDSTDGVVVFDRRGFPIKGNANADAAILAFGGDLNLAAPRRIPALAADQAEATARAPHRLPAWLRPEWLEPVVERGEQLGTLLVIPLPRLRGRPQPAIPARQPAGNDGFQCVIGRDPLLLDAVARARQLARSHAPVLLLGETGVGKEVFAQGLHAASPAKDGPFVALNCGGLSRELLASELFGYCEGAFTGARRGGMMGKIEAANGGSLFLDEIGEMPVDLQPQLLRVLEQGEIYRLGENTPRKVRFRLIAATNRKLREEVAEGRFRMDLFYRVAVTSVYIPPLRERRGDIRELALHFLARFTSEHGLSQRQLAADALARLEAYSWPGNVRELRNVIESMLLTSLDDVLHEDCLPAELLSDARKPVLQAGPSAGGRNLVGAERNLIQEAIAAAGGNLTRAARELGIAKSTLYLKLRKYGLDEVLSNVRGDAGV